MHITYLRLKRYTRLMNSNIQELEWTPTKNLLIMIGSNGSGKSSVMDELTMLPSSDHRSYESGGEKEVHGYHNGQLYVVKSVYGHGTGRHSFMREDEELNPGGTFKIQEELCFQEFGLDREIHRLLTGRIKFTQLNVGKRRELLTRMSIVNMDYAFDKLKQVSTEHRSQRGVIDTISRRLLSENQDIPSDAEMSLMRDQVGGMTTRLNKLFQGRSNQAPDKQFYNNEAIQTELNTLIQDAHKLLRMYAQLPKRFKIQSRQDASTYLQSLSQDWSSTNAVIDKLASELDKLRMATPQSMEVSADDVKHLQEQLAQHQQQAQAYADLVEEMDETRFPLFRIDIAGDPLGKLRSVFERWTNAINSFPNNVEGFMSRENMQQAQTRRKELLEARAVLNFKHEGILQRISRLRGCQHVKCPSCNHEFQPGVDAHEGENLEAEKAPLEEALDKIDKDLKVIDEYTEDFQSYSSHVFSYVQLTRDYPEFNDLWEYNARHLVMFREPAKYKVDAMNWFDSIEAMIKADLELEQAEIVEKRLKVIAEIDQDAVGFMKRRTADLENDIDELYQKAGLYKNDISDLSAAVDSVERYIKATEAIFERYSSWQERVRQHAEYLLDRAYGEEISTIQMRLADTNRQLNILQQRETTIRTLENEVNIATDAYADWSLILKAMSAKGGLIGRYLMGFMYGVVDIVNAYIGEVWTYPMEVLPSNVEKDELDYKFPLKVSGGKIVTKDIEDGSDSQLEMVNFAFTMAARKFMNLDDYPLYLDEFGRTFDEQHRANLIPFISRLIENGQVKQVFFISHFQSTHGAFNQAEFMVLDPTNVTVPEIYNKNLVLK